MPYQEYNLFLDDLRDPATVYPGEEWVVVRSYDAFVHHITQHGRPAAISFDNDLGCDEHGASLPDGIAAIKWLSEWGLVVPAIYIHSDNLVASEFIESYAKTWHKILALDGLLDPSQSQVRRHSALHRKWNVPRV